MREDEGVEIKVAAKEGFPWGAFLIEKAFDVILIPLGLFLALWFQGWVDDRKSEEDYVDQLVSFRDEIAANRAKGTAMEAQIGPLAERDSGASLGPLGAAFPAYDKVIAETADMITCLEVMLTPPDVAPSDAELEALGATEEGRAQLAADIAASEAYERRVADCNAQIEKAETPPPEGDGAVFEVVDLSPLYRYEVWQMYLQDGIKLFKGEAAKSLGRKLGEAYALMREIEARVAAIEDAYNEEITRRIGAQHAVEAELNHLLENVGEENSEMLRRMNQIASEVRRERYSMISFKMMLDTKVGRLKEFILDMAKRLDELDAALSAEITARQ